MTRGDTVFLSEKGIEGFIIKAEDGEVGQVEEFYFDDQTWTIRYLVVSTQMWLPRKKVLISPNSIQKVLLEEEIVHVSLTKKQVKDSPDIDTKQIVSREDEIELNSYYNWPSYWESSESQGTSSHIKTEFTGDEMKDHKSNGPPGTNEENDSLKPHLRSTQEVIKYHILAIDKEFGHVEDFIVDEKTWKVRYLVVNTKNWWFGKEILVSPEWIKDIDWTEKIVKIDLDEKTIKEGPEFSSDKPIDRGFEEKLYEKYNKNKYWKT